MAVDFAIPCLFHFDVINRVQLSPLFNVKILQSVLEGCEVSVVSLVMNVQYILSNIELYHAARHTQNDLLFKDFFMCGDSL